jgi:acyl transferase domain-containing protein
VTWAIGWRSSERIALASGLRIGAEGNSAPGIHWSGRRGKRKRRIAFLFSGQELLDDAPVSDLYGSEPVFREVMDRCTEIYGRAGNGALSELLIAPGFGRLACARYTQPALFALQSALVALWDSWGIRPDCVLGHGVGELAAAACAGAFNVEDGMALVIERARLMDQLEARTGRSLIAVDAAARAESELISMDDGASERFAAFAARVRHSEVKRRLFTATRDFPAPEGIEEWPRYSREHARRPVDFLAAMRRLGETDCDVFVEIGPKSNLVALGRECLTDRDALWLASLQTGVLSERAALVDAFSSLYAAGCPVDFPALHGGRGGAWTDIPLYPFERQRYWLDDATSTVGESRATEALDAVK